MQNLAPGKWSKDKHSGLLGLPWLVWEGKEREREKKGGKEEGSVRGTSNIWLSLKN